MEKKLYLSESDKKIGGVCGGISEFFGLESTLVRVIWILLILVFKWIPLLVYLILWLVIPKPGNTQNHE